MQRTVWTALIVLVCLIGVSPQHAQSQDEAAGADGAVIKPYTGDPIYLPEGDPPPPPSVVEPYKQRVEKYEDGSPRIERQYARMSDGSIVANGLYKEYFQSGQIFVLGRFEMGYATGEWVYYHESGEVAKKVAYQQGDPQGAVEVRRADGTLAEKRGYDAGKRTGDWYRYGEDGEQMLAEEHYEAGEPSGVWKQWYPSGQLMRETPFKEGKRDGEAREWYESGEPRATVTFVAGKRDGPAAAWSAEGEKTERLYEDDKLVSGEAGGE